VDFRIVWGIGGKRRSVSERMAVKQGRIGIVDEVVEELGEREEMWACSSVRRWTWV